MMSDDKVTESSDEALRRLSEEFNRLHNIPLNVTDSITHEEFVAGVAKGTIGCKFLGVKPFQIISGSRKIIFNIFGACYQLAPLLTLPFWAYHEGNWWLLFGIPVASLIAPIYASFRVRRSRAPGALVLLLCIASWIFLGIHNYFTFFLLCFSWGCMFYLIAEGAQNEYALQTLTERRELFERAVTEKIIFVVRKQQT